MKMLKSFGIVSVIILFALASCSKEDGGMENGSVENVTLDIIGDWYCTSQKWTEAGETDFEEYEPSETYSMSFYSNGTGRLRAGSDELFEIGSNQDFTWHINKSGKKSIVHTDIYGGNDYTIDKLTSTSLVMTWTDEDYSIQCKFVKE